MYQACLKGGCNNKKLIETPDGWKCPNCQTIVSAGMGKEIWHASVLLQTDDDLISASIWHSLLLQVRGSNKELILGFFLFTNFHNVECFFGCRVWLHYGNVELLKKMYVDVFIDNAVMEGKI